MKLLTSLDQLQVGTRLKIVGKNPRDTYKSVSVKKIQQVDWDNHEKHVEVIINMKKNYWFNLNLYLGKASRWVREVYVLEGTDKRIKRLPERDFRNALAQ